MNFNEFQKFLDVYPSESIVFVGLGNLMRTDDGVGLMLLDRIRLSNMFSNAHFIHAGTNPENFLEDIIQYDPRAVVFIDAARFNQSPGTIQWLTKRDLDQFRISTHAFSMRLVEDYLNTHHPMDFHYLGIQSFSTQMGDGLSTLVQKSMDKFFNDIKMISAS